MMAFYIMPPMPPMPPMGGIAGPAGAFYPPRRHHDFGRRHGPATDAASAAQCGRPWWGQDTVGGHIHVLADERVVADVGVRFLEKLSDDDGSCDASVVRDRLAGHLSALSTISAPIL